MNNALARTDFYTADAAKVLAEDFDYTVIKSEQPLPALHGPVHSGWNRVLTTVVAAAVTAILTIPTGGGLSFSPSDARELTEAVSRAPNVHDMTRRMLERAAIATRLFQHMPDTGNDEIDPDYDL